jgi:hypothetical protein
LSSHESLALIYHQLILARRREVAIEWMTAHLTESFSRVEPGGVASKPPRCRDCHGGDLGSPEFRSKIVLTDLATGAVDPPPPPASAAPPANAAPPPPAAPPAPSASAAPLPLPDFGKR